MQWDGKFGPASVLVILQTLAILVGGLLAFGRVADGVENSKLAVAELRVLVNEIQKGSTSSIERITKVETSLGFVVKSLSRVEAKLDSQTLKP